MKRIFALALLAALAAFGRSDQPPRKVIVGTMIQGYYGAYPGLEKRLAELRAAIDAVAAQSVKQYGRGPDLIVLPEAAVNMEAHEAMPYSGSIQAAFSEAAARHHSYVVVPMYLLEDGRKFNAAVLLDRRGAVAGIYRKMHLAVTTGSDSMEDGSVPGKEIPVFECDFGKLGIQICFDMEFDYGWDELARKGAELVVWPTASPQTAHPARRAAQEGYYVVSSPWRNNASVFEPTGKTTAQIKEPQKVLVQELDLSYAIVPWSPRLRNGAALADKYGAKVGFRYYEEEDLGIFWSNDPAMSISQMIRSLGLAEANSELLRIRKLYGQAGVPVY